MSFAGTTTNTGPHVITIKAGETYVLKKTAKILTVASFGNPTVDAPCFTDAFSNKEEYACYVFKGFLAKHDDPSINGQSQFIQGIYIGSTFYPMLGKTDIRVNNGTLFMAQLAKDPFRGVMRDICFVEDNDNSRGDTFYYAFMAIPSIAETMKVLVKVIEVHTRGDIEIYYPFVSLGHLRSDDGDTTGFCGCGSL